MKAAANNDATEPAMQTKYIPKHAIEALAELLLDISHHEFVYEEFVMELPVTADHTTATDQVEGICYKASHQLLGDNNLEF